MIFKNSIPFLFLTLTFTIPSQEPFVQTGTASYYADKFHNRPTSSGEKYDKNELTAAHKSLPFGTILLVTNLKNDSTVLLKVNDRIGTNKRIIDVSLAGAKQLNFVRAGLAKVRIEIVQPDNSMTDKVEETIFNQAQTSEISETVMEGKNLMDSKCIKCHKMKVIEEYSQLKWDIILPKMAKKAKLSSDEQEKMRTFVYWKLEN